MAKKGEVKVGRGSAPAREVSFVSIVAYVPKVFYSALAMAAGRGRIIASETR